MVLPRAFPVPHQCVSPAGVKPSYIRALRSTPAETCIHNPSSRPTEDTPDRSRRTNGDRSPIFNINKEPLHLSAASVDGATSRGDAGLEVSVAVVITVTDQATEPGANPVTVVISVTAPTPCGTAAAPTTALLPAASVAEPSKQAQRRAKRAKKREVACLQTEHDILRRRTEAHR